MITLRQNLKGITCRRCKVLKIEWTLSLLIFVRIHLKIKLFFCRKFQIYGKNLPYKFLFKSLKQQNSQLQNDLVFPWLGIPIWYTTVHCLGVTTNCLHLLSLHTEPPPHKGHPFDQPTDPRFFSHLRATQQFWCFLPYSHSL